MVRANDFLSRCSDNGYDFVTGVPCSFLTPLINYAILDSNIDYVGATNEGEAVAIAAGAWLAGRNTISMFQNSGLGNAVNPLTSLNTPFGIPSLLITTWRGEPGIKDEPQHELMGQITHDLLGVMRIPYDDFPATPDQISDKIGHAADTMASARIPFAFVMPKGTVTEEDCKLPPSSESLASSNLDVSEAGERPQRFDILMALMNTMPDDAAVIATTGKCGRELFTLGDRDQNLYLVGSMGCAGGVGLGVALNTKRPVCIIDGDGAALMKLGTLATIGATRPPNLIHIVLDNGTHDSTGGQATVSNSVDFAQVAESCSYPWTGTCDTVDGFNSLLADAMKAQGPRLVHVKIAPGSISNLGRPTISPRDVADRFRSFLSTA